MPSDLLDPSNAIALRYWNENEERIRRDAVLADVSLPGFRELCLNFQEKEQLRLREELTFPLVTRLKNLEKRFDSLLRDFGMTPVSRRKLPASPIVRTPGERRFVYRQRGVG